MTAILILWGHALAALAFGVLGVEQLRRPVRGWPPRGVAVALFATALWALAVAGIDARDVAARLAESIRNIAWLGVIYLTLRRREDRGLALGAVFAMVGVMAIASVVLALIETMPVGAGGRAALIGARQLTRMMGAIGGLVLVRHLDAAFAERRGRVRPLVLAIALMWGIDLVIAATGYALEAWPASVVAVRGFAMAGGAFLLGLAARRGGDWDITVSRSATTRALSIMGVIAWAGVTVLLTRFADDVAGVHARIVQTAIVLGSTAALMTLLSTPWLRAWTKVKIAKHLFPHRYDYRTEWQRFGATLGTPGDDASLDQRIVQAVAYLTDSPAALLLVPDGAGLGAGATWNWDATGTADGALVRHLTATMRIIELDMVRADTAPADEIAAIPGWMRERADAWALVPLLHGPTLVGAILLARPPLDRALDWEDLDLLRIAGRQAASYLAEDRAHAALADAERFDEFNRRFAFIMHDIKNLVSGLTLVARNAERHADNPEFRADMVATLQDSATRMNALLARLSQHHHAAPEAAQPIDLAALATRTALARRAQHAVTVRGEAVALAQPGRLEQLLGHLVQNAVEATPGDDPVVVVLGREHDRATIDVVDHGCGMTPGFVRDQLFRPFASSKPGGFGIGAYEARQLAEAMGGTITVHSREGEGTRFRVTLPVADPMEAAA